MSVLYGENLPTQKCTGCLQESNGRRTRGPNGNAMRTCPSLYIHRPCLLNKWISPPRSIRRPDKLLLAATGTVNLGFGSHKFSFFPRLLTCFTMRPPLRRTEGSDYYWSLPIYYGRKRLYRSDFTSSSSTEEESTWFPAYTSSIVYYRVLAICAQFFLRLKWISQKRDVRMRTGLIWLTIRTSGGILWNENGPSTYIYEGRFLE